MTMTNPQLRKTWTGYVPEKDNFGKPIRNVFYDAATIYGPWAFMTETSWVNHGNGRLGLGFGQKYQKQSDGVTWLKVGG